MSDDLVNGLKQAVGIVGQPNTAPAVRLLLLTSAAEIERLKAENARLREALEQARIWFQHYAEGHTAKGDADKAKRNQDRADFCARAELEGK